MGKTSQKEKRLAGRVSLALAAGMFSVVPVAHGMPTLDKIDTGAVKFDGATPNPGDVLASGAPITSGTKNNIINWKDFSVAHGEHVNFADNNNYMNIVTGKATSAIDGMLSSKGGDIYVINPNGVIFGKNAQVNVGNLYVSTRAATQDVKDAFLAGNNADDGEGNLAPICTPFGDVLTAINNNTASATADVVNLIDKNGYVAANKVVMEGKNIRFLNTDSVAKADTIEVVTSTVDDVTTTTYNTTNTYVSGDTEHGFTINKINNDVDGHLVTGSTDKSNIQLRADGYLHVGDGRNTGNMTGTDAAAHYTATNKAGVNYALVRTAAELQAIRTNDSNANYMLANNINNATITKPIGTATSGSNTGYNTPSGTPFKGKFDGMFFTVENLDLTVSSAARSYAGLFAYTQNATIENVGVSGANVAAYRAGSIVGYADNTTLRNVWNVGGKIGYNDTWSKFTGGLVGVATGGTRIESSYNAGEVLGAGLVGTLNNATIINAYNIGNIKDNGDSSIAGIFSQANGTNNTVQNTFTAAKYKGNSSGGTEKTAITVLDGAKVTWGYNYIIHNATSYSKNYLGSDTNTGNTQSWKTYSGVNNSGFNISSVGGEKTTWRIYEGSSLPMLTAFFRGTVSADYAYNDNGTEKFSSAAKNKTYDANMVDPYHYVSAEGGAYVYRDTEGYVRYDADVDNADAPRYARQDGAHYLGMNATGTTGSNNDGGANVTITESDNKNAGTFALFKGQQQGYDLCDNYFTINKRQLKVSVENNGADKVYDGENTLTVEGEALDGQFVNAADALQPGIIGSDVGNVHLTGKVKYTYTSVDNTIPDADVGDKTVKIEATNTLGVSNSNYELVQTSGTLADNVDAKITPRSVVVELYQKTGINKTYDGTSAVTDESKQEIEGLTTLDGAGNIKTASALRVATDNKTQEQINNLFNNEVVFSKEGVTSQYVDDDGAEAVSVANATQVAYTGVALSDKTANSGRIANYQLMYRDKDGNLQKVTDDGTLYADGKINRRSISIGDFVYGGTDGTVSKTYDGTTTMTGGDIVPVTVNNQVTAPSATNTTGLLQADADKVKFITTGTATFYTTNDANKKEAMDATDSELEFAAHYAGYGVQIAKDNTYSVYGEGEGYDAAVAANYVVNGVNIETENASFEVMGAGRIEKRTVTVKLGQATGIDKIYDGTTDVADQYKTWNYVYADSDDTDEEKALKQLVSGDGATIGFTSATYDTKDVALNDAGEVLRGTDGNEKDDTKTVTFKLAMNGTKAANYNLKTATQTADDLQEVTLTGKGKIKQRELNVTFADVKKVYDGYTNVTNTRTDVIRPIIAEKTDDKGLTGNDGYVGDSTNDNFIFRLNGAAGIRGAYGDKDDNEVFTENKNIGNRDVEYTNLQTAIKSKNYKVSNTKYGKGIIQKKTIKSQGIDGATNIVNNTVLTKVYDGNDQNTQYIGRNAMGEKDTSGNVTSPAFLAWVENDDTIPDKDTLTITIAEAVYAGVDQGDYIYDKTTKTGGVALTFRISGSDAGNYEFEGADENGNLSMTKQGYTGHIDQRKVAVSLDATQNPTKQYDGDKNLRKADGTTIGNDVIKDWFTLSEVASEATAGRPSGIVENEDVVLQVTSAQYTDENAGAASGDKTVRYTFVLANGTNNKAANYTLVNSSGDAITQIDGIGTINKRQVFVSSVDEMDKPYDGNGNVLASADGTGVHISAVDGTAVGNGVLTTEGLNVIETAASAGAGKVAGVYGDLVSGTFTANTAGNVKRATVNDPAGEQDVKYTGIGTALGSNYELYKKNDDSYTKDTSGIVYGKGTIELANIDLTNAYMDNSIRKEYDNSLAIAPTDAWSAVKGIDSKWVSLLDVEAAFTDNVNAGMGKPISLTIALKSGGAALNYSISGATFKVLKNQNGDAPTGEIYKKTLYAHVVENPTTGTTKEYLTKTYDGTANLSAAVLPNVITWVQLEEGSQQAITTINDSSGIGLDSGITAAYADKNAAATKTVQFNNVNLTNNNAGNYVLVLHDKDGNVATQLATTGAIDKRPISITSITNDVITKTYNRSEYVTDEAIAALSPTLEQAIYSGEVLANSSGQISGDTVLVNTGQLKGIYGTWDTTTDSDNPTFTANSHVAYNNNIINPGNEALQDLLFYDIALTGTDAGNYQLTNDQGPTVLNLPNNNIATTSYFQTAVEKGKITPLAITMESVSSSQPVTIEKIYDGHASVEGYNPTQGKTLKATDYFKVFYDDNKNGTFDSATDVYMTYTATAKFVDSDRNDAPNAGPGKAVSYSNFAFDTTTLGDFGISGETLANYFNNGETTYTNAGAAPTTGSIARRMLDVSVDATTPKNGDNTKIYDGKTLLIDTTAYPASNTYSTNFQNPNNTGTTGLVGTDTVSITYVANFADTSANIDPDTQKDGEGWTTKDVTYTFTLGAGDDSDNYTLTEAGRYNDNAARTDTRTGAGAIRKREVYVEFKDSTGLDKMYDNDASLFVGKDANDIPVLADGRNVDAILKLVAIGDDTGIISEADEVTHETGQLDSEHVIAKYVNSSGIEDEDVATTTSGRITTKKVYFQNLNIVNSDGSTNTNYVVKAKNGNTVGNKLPTATDAENFAANAKEETLVGSGTIQPRTIDLDLKDKPVQKVYNGTAEVEDYGGKAYRSNNLIVKATGVTDGVNHYGLAAGDTLDDVQLVLDSALYYDAQGNATASAGTGLGVTYKLKWKSDRANNNYELVRTSIETKGDINKKKITLKQVDVDTMSKTYDGTRNLAKTPTALAGEMFEGVLDKDKPTLLTISESYYEDENGNTRAAANSTLGTPQAVTVKYALNNNYMLENGETSGTFIGTGRIDRAPLTLVPNSATYSSGDTIPTDGYTGTVMGFKNGENLADGYYDVTFARDPQNLATTPGKYSLVGYVNGLLPTQANGLMYYNNLGDGATGNYYFVQQPNNALQINAKADVMDEVNQSTIADKKFTPDDYSYNRMSKDPDLTRMNRESSATVQYSEKGVNIDGDDTKSGLSALADIKGAGSVVNLEGAFIRTSAPAEQPETVAAEAALPVPETEESDISSISLEYAGDGDNSQALLEILTNASSNAENKGTSIVIDAQDEDKEDAEEEKSRRAIFADRSNIGIETLGDAVNLNQMIG